jgi:hypothetical protein
MEIGMLLPFSHENSLRLSAKISKVMTIVALFMKSSQIAPFAKVAMLTEQIS